MLKKYGFRDWDSVLAALGHGGLKEGQILNKLVDAYEKEHKKEITDEKVLEASRRRPEKSFRSPRRRVALWCGASTMWPCGLPSAADPIPGDEIVGFVTRGRGVTIHRTDCINVMNLSESDRARLIDAEWQGSEVTSGLYTAEINVYANNRMGLLVDISRIFTERKIDLAGINSRTSKQGTATISLTFDVHSKEELANLVEKLRQVDSVLDIERTTG
ncbi:MAG: ACT domain-containing protein [Lachnospiraceae bacterium]